MTVSSDARIEQYAI